MNPEEKFSRRLLFKMWMACRIGLVGAADMEAKLLRKLPVSLRNVEQIVRDRVH